jgi:hypothetical protein
MATAARRLAAPACALALLASVGAAMPADAAAAYSTRVCAAQAVVRTSPGGYTVGYLYRRDRVRVSRKSANRRWARVTTPTDLRGWVSARALCR